MPRHSKGENCLLPASNKIKISQILATVWSMKPTGSWINMSESVMFPRQQQTKLPRQWTWSWVFSEGPEPDKPVGGGGGEPDQTTRPALSVNTDQEAFSRLRYLFNAKLNCSLCPWILKTWLLSTNTLSNSWPFLTAGRKKKLLTENMGQIPGVKVQDTQRKENATVHFLKASKLFLSGPETKSGVKEHTLT